MKFVLFCRQVGRSADIRNVLSVFEIHVPALLCARTSCFLAFHTTDSFCYAVRAITPARFLNKKLCISFLDPRYTRRCRRSMRTARKVEEKGNAFINFNIAKPPGEDCLCPSSHAFSRPMEDSRCMMKEVKLCTSLPSYCTNGKRK